MKRELRHDRAELRPGVVLPDGSMVLDGLAFKVGVVEYRLPDGSISRELKHPDDFLRPDTLETLGFMPVTDGHPSEDEYPHGVTPDNWQTLAVGQTDSQVTALKNGFVKVALSVRRSDALQSVKNGRRQLSLGTWTQIEETPGEWRGLDGKGVPQPYDRIQRNPVHNHIALVDIARVKGSRVGEVPRLDGIINGAAGVMTRALTLDEADASIDTPETPEGQRMKFVKLRVDGAEYEVPAELAPLVQGLMQKQDGLEAKITELNTSLGVVTAERDELKSKIAIAEQRQDGDDRIKWFDERTKLVNLAAKTKVQVQDGLSNSEIALAIARSQNDSIPEDAGPDFVNGYLAALQVRQDSEDTDDPQEPARQRTDELGRRALGLRQDGQFRPATDFEQEMAAAEAEMLSGYKQ